MIIDCGAFCGHWPFRRLRHASPASLAEAMRENGMRRAVVSSLDAIFFNDPNEGDEALKDALAPSDWLAVSHNPLLPFAQADMAENRLGAVALRLYPGYHGYAPDDACAVSLCRAAAQRGLVIFLTVKLEDVRLEYILRQQVPALESALALAEAVPEGTFVLSGYALSDAVRQGGQIAGVPNVYLDTAFCGNLTFPYERLLDAFPHKRVLFATYQPLLCPAVNRLAMAYADIPEEARADILYRNAERLFCKA